MDGLSKNILTSKKVINACLDLLFPPSLYCICCGNIIDGTRMYELCDHCIRHIRWDTEPPREINGMKVLRCSEYGIYERTIIFSLKYNGKTYIARDVAEIIRDRIEPEQLNYDVIVPVPLSRQREMSRGFNQTALIGKYLASMTEKSYAAGALKRTRDTRPMRSLSPTERVVNVKDAFAPGGEPDLEKIKNKRVLLIDDFFTTGSTALECRRVLMKAGASDVVFVAFAARY